MVAGTGRAQSRYRFGRCELDVSSGELRRDGVTTQLHGQPLQVLLLLIERAGDLVTRGEIQRQVWTDETFVRLRARAEFDRQAAARSARRLR